MEFIVLSGRSFACFLPVKGTFAQEFMRMLLGKNAVTIGSEDFENDFNAHYSYARLIFIDEALVGDRRKSLEKIKRISTSPTIMINDKGKSQFEVDFVGNFILASTNEDSAIYLTKQDDRYWIRNVPTPKERRVSFKEDLRGEVPKLFTFLSNRQLKLESVLNEKEIPRMYFHGFE